MPKIATQWQRFDDLSPAALYEILRFRQSIFVVEQSSPYPDLDGLDKQAWHLVLRVEGALAGYLRLVPMPGLPPLTRIGRVAVAAHLRGRGLGQRLMREALGLQRERYPTHDLVLAAQARLVPFYRAFGFVPTGEPYDEFGMLHVDMGMRRDA
jgi:ElaA protein